MIRQPDGVGAGRLVFFYAEAHREDPHPDASGILVLPRPHAREVVTLRRSREGFHLRRRVQPEVLEPRRPLRPARYEGEFPILPDGNLTRRWTEHRYFETFPPQQPGRADEGMARERKLRTRREDSESAALGVVHEDRLREAEVRRHSLAFVLRYLAPVEEDAERVAAGAVLADKDFQYV